MVPSLQFFPIEILYLFLINAFSPILSLLAQIPHSNQRLYWAQQRILMQIYP